MESDKAPLHPPIESIRPTQAPRKRRGLGIQWRLIGYLSLFVVIIVAILWVLQVMLLDTFYETIKDREMKITVGKLQNTVSDTELFTQTVYDCASDYSICIQVWQIQNSRASLVVSADVSSRCLIHHVSGNYLSLLYGKAKEQGGEYVKRLQLQSGIPLEEDTVSPDDTVAKADQETTALCVKILQDAQGNEYVAFLDCELTPMSATVSTLKAQFALIAAVFLLLAVLLALLMSRRISGPLVRMTKEAHILAEGKYDVNFTGDGRHGKHRDRGYRETRELADTLNYAAEELSKTDRLQKELIANISHDLRTPLTMITGYSEVMRDIPGENTPENVQVIIDEANHLSGLVNDLLDLSRIRSGTRTLQTEVFDLSLTVQEVLVRYDKLTAHEGYRILAKIDAESEVCADRTMLMQVVYNLINNAINYCGEDKTVEVQVRRIEDTVRVDVCDHGAGIEQEQLPLIWDRYYKIDRVHRRSMIGTGLGLSIVKNILEQHHAVYGVESEVGKGSDFWFALPLEAATKATDISESQERKEEEHAIGE